MSVILLNCVTLGLYRPCQDETCDSARCRVLRVSDHLIFGFFAVEMVIKMTAMGAFGRDAYLSETWNRLDFFIVVAGSLEYCLDMGNINLSAIRTVRVLRPLKAINRIPSLRILVMLLLDTLPMLGNVLLLCFFVFFVFGIVGVQMWAGLLRQRCFLEMPANATIGPPGYLSPYYYRRVKLLNPPFYQSSSAEAERDYVCSMDKDSGVHRCEDFPPTRVGGKRCNASAWEREEVEDGDCVNWNQYYTQCRAGDRNPFQGAISFDNIGLAWVAIFLVISLEGWTDIMYYVQDAHSFWDFTYFVLLIVVGSFFMINLCLVVIATQFSETKKREMERMRLERARFHSTSTLASASNASASGCYTQLFKYAAHLGRRARRRCLRFFRSRRKAQAPPPSITLRTNKKAGRWHPGQSSMKSPESTLTADPGTPLAPYASPEISDIDPSPRDVEDEKGCVELLAAQGAVLAGFGNTFGVLYSDMEKSEKQHVSAPQLLFYSPETGECWSEGRGRNDSCGGVVGEAWFRWWGRQQSKVKSLTDHPYFQRGILVAILVNTLSMGIEYHNQPEELTLAVELSNVLFTVVFCLEMVLKMVAEGFCTYISSGFNVFDSVIVVLSLVELCQSSDGGSGLSVLRTFRLLRILKLVRFLPALRRQLIIMLRTIDNVTIFFALLILFIFIFSILGMNLFGCRFCKKVADGATQCDRKNFDSLLWAIVTVFQILTQEDWNVVLFNGMEKTSHWAALYFVALMTFGNYVLFNLLVAILVEGFSQEDDKRECDNLSPSCSLCEKQDCETSDEKDNEKWIRDDDPKDNIEKEIKMKAYVLRVVRGTPGNGDGGGPPLITHTAATPQGSPNATLPPPTRDRTGQDTNDKNPLQPGDIVLQLQPQDICSRRSSSVILALSRQSSIISSISRKNSLGPCFGLQGGVNGWRANYRRKKSESSENGSGSEDVVLNNVASSHSPSPAFENGSIPTLLQNTPNNKRNSSVRSSSFSQYRDAHRPSINGGSPAPDRRLSSVCSLHNDTEDNFKTNNLEENQAEKDDEAMSTECELPSKLCWFIKPKGWLKEREDYSLFIFSRSNWLRRSCTRLANNHWFDSGILVFIASNCVTLAMERPTIPPDSGERMFLTAANYTFTAVFTFEMAVKVVSTGLWYGRGAYFRSGWNVMDGFVVGISLVDFLLSLAAEGSPKIFGILRVFRLLRSLRPLRVINRAPGLKLVVQTLLSSLRPIGNIVLICCTFFVIFGILGVQLFKGSMYYCEGPTASKVRNKLECLQDSRNVWLNRKYNFDNLGQALMSLFVLSSKDGWVNIMYTGLDAVGVDQQPIENYNEWRLLYFISFLLLVAFFVLNMFVGVVVENFHRCREQQEREERARRAAKRAKKMDRKRRKMRAPPYYADYSKARLSLHNVITSKYFDLAIAAVIGLNVVTMAMEFYMMPKNLEYALKVFNYFFTAVFIAEAGMKVVALGIIKYFKNRWNQLDMAIVALSIAGIVLEKMESDLIPINPTIIRVFRVMRIARVLKLLKMAKGIRALLDTVMQALPQVGNLGLLFFLLFFIFAALGVELFGRLECTEDIPCEGLGEHAHFKDFGMAFLTLFRVATGDNWNGIMKDTLRDNCDSSGDCVRNCCVSGVVAPLYFVIFVLMAQFVLVNVVVAVLMKHLEESHKQMDDDADMDAELRAELEAEQKRLLGEQAERLKRAQTMRIRASSPIPTRPLLVKMSSLPPDFVFPFDMPSDRGLRRASLNLQNYRGGMTPDLGFPFPNRRSPTPDVNIRRASPDESKVSVANLSPVPPPSPSPPPPDEWACVMDSKPASNGRLLPIVREVVVKNEGVSSIGRGYLDVGVTKENESLDGVVKLEGVFTKNGGSLDVDLVQGDASENRYKASDGFSNGSHNAPKEVKLLHIAKDNTEKVDYGSKLCVPANDNSTKERCLLLYKRSDCNDARPPIEYNRCTLNSNVNSPVLERSSIDLGQCNKKNEETNDRTIISIEKSKFLSNDKLPSFKVSTHSLNKVPNESLLSAKSPILIRDNSLKRTKSEKLVSAISESASKTNSVKSPVHSTEET
ncbi:hypothetical protein JTE90_009024 [Oedothorax gibbosus]|uniref:Voltage-dependent T-type calcium channel subunit alpha n=1 Tax=Oedothorax gibbosus TaxID=931172 RepID=A0AAV6VMP1_9ARAC|nr:hypothetical protein JTE90_009024 [Oedothorax gibbosus]